MTLLHDYFNLRNKQAFYRLLESGADRVQSNSTLSSSGGKSWNRPSPLASALAVDVNARDWLGRTVLHLACVSLDTVEYVKLLLRHPMINVNLADVESHWTPLHRALYHANFPAALLLLQRSDTDKSLQDLEGYTAFDLYNSTLNGTKPSENEVNAELYTWGANRNAALGLGDGGDRIYPDQVILRRQENHLSSEIRTLNTRFSPIHVRQTQMSKLHTAVVTSESSGNLRLCGFGSGGRLGPGQHTQYSLKTLPQLYETIVSVALGQDHTLALTKSGEVLSWGLNRFSQLGYVVEPTTANVTFGRLEEPIQATARKVLGPLRKEVVRGIAASKGASACWTSADVYTWGTNNGQLGYDKVAQPVQILPRKATKVTHPVIAISMTDMAMACLLVSKDVICIYNDRHVKITFPGHAFPLEMQPYRPPQAIQDAKIAKITSCNDLFAALSFNGEMFTFSVPNLVESDNSLGKDRPNFKPQRVWALRKKFTAVKDVALGSDGSIIVCTESGHVFIRSRSPKAGQSVSGKAFKFQRVPNLQRVTQVCANTTGAFGAHRVDYNPKPIEIRGNRIAQDLATLQFYLSMYQDEQYKSQSSQPRFPDPSPAPDEELEDISVDGDIQKLLELLDILVYEKKNRLQLNQPVATPYKDHLPHGADVLVCTASGAVFPAHRVILGARAWRLRAVLEDSKIIQDRESKISIRLSSARPVSTTRRLSQIEINSCHPISILIFLHYIYSDDLLAIWDRRVSIALERHLHKLRIKPADIKSELLALANVLELPLLAQAIVPSVKRIPAPSLAREMEDLFQAVQGVVPEQSAIVHDVILQLADKNVRCHSVVLRARSAFFADFFDGEDWTAKRRDANGMVVVDMKHLRWHIMEYVLCFMCCGGDEEMFETLDFANSIDEVLDFMFDVMAAANELLLDRLVLLCSAVILNHTNVYNALFILADATHLHAEQLAERLQSYMTVNMELFLDGGMLDDIPLPLVEQLSRFAQQKQVEKSSISRSNILAQRALVLHAEWLALQDIPSTIPRSTHLPSRKSLTTIKLSPPGPCRRAPRLPLSPPQSPSIQPERTIRRPPSGDDIFMMDDADAFPSLSLDQPQLTTPNWKSSNTVANQSPIWKAPSVPRVDMKTVMAEAARERPLSSKSTHAPSSHRLPTSGASSLLTPLQPSNVAQTKQSPNAGSSPRPPPPSPPRSSGGPQGLGPIITPTRQVSSTNIRRASGKAWNQAPVPHRTPSPTSGMSFVAIQQLQLEQVAGHSKDKRSLREIQEEEQSLQQEADFLAWWAAEEERIRLETEIVAVSHDARPKVMKERGKKVDQTGNQVVRDNRRRAVRGSGRKNEIL